MTFPDLPLDGNWVDLGSFATGLIYIFVARYRSTSPKPLLAKQTGKDFADGMALFPLAILALSPLSSGLLKSLVDASKLSLVVAGMFAILAILET